MEIMSDELERCITYRENKIIVDNRLIEIRAKNRIVDVSSSDGPMYLLSCSGCGKTMESNDPCKGEIVICKECSKLYQVRSKYFIENVELDKNGFFAGCP